MTDDNPNTETRDDIVKLEFNFSTGEFSKPYRAFIKETELIDKTDGSLADAIRKGAVVELSTLIKSTRSRADYDFYRGDEQVLIDFSEVICAIRMSESEVKKDE